MLADSGEYIPLCSVTEVKLPWESRLQRIFSAGQITPTFHDTSSDSSARLAVIEIDERPPGWYVWLASLLSLGVAIAGMLMV
jgi:hypothetical protein